MRWHVATLVACLAATGALAACGSTGNGGAAGDGGNNNDSGTIGDMASTDTGQDAGVTDAGCKTGTACNMGEFCNAAGVCCPAFGCNPQCPNGVKIDAKGCETCECAPAGTCTSNADCGKSQLCAKPAGQCGGQGECKAIPQNCPMTPMPTEGVCACDGKNYPDSCTAAAAGVNVDHAGTCAQPPTGLSYFTTCGYPVCQNDWQPTAGVPLCTTEKQGAACSVEGQKCDAKAGCGQFLLCAKSDPKQSGCPISKAKYKSDVRYVDGTERQLLASELLATRLATYRYTAAGAQGPRHLGFIIDDQPGSPAVDAQRDMVDLYGYLSLSVATLQEQQKQLEQLRHELEQVKAHCSEVRTDCGQVAPICR